MFVNIFTKLVDLVIIVKYITNIDIGETT